MDMNDTQFLIADMRSHLLVFIHSGLAADTATDTTLPMPVEG